MDVSRVATVPRSLVARLSRRAALRRFGAASLVAVAGATRAGEIAAQDASPAAEAGRASYLVIRRYRVKPGTTFAELTRQVETGFVPIVREVPGFVHYYLVEASDDEHVSVGVFADQAGADESTARAASWAQQTMAELVEVPAFEVIAGPVGLNVAAGTPATPVP